MELPLDYMTLRVIWWGLVGVLLIGFAIMDGFDMGVAALLPFVAKNDSERRTVINTVGATWEGNQVWFILGGGAIFAAWPFVYAVSFSGFYLAMFLVLTALILRPVGFKYRSKRPGKAWRRNWDWALFAGGFIPALVFGVAIGNVLQGAPFSFDSDLRATYHDMFLGGLLGLFSPFTVLCGLTSVAMLVLQGSTWLGLKLEKGIVRERALRFGLFAALGVILLFAAGYVFIRFSGLGFTVVGSVNSGAPSNPIHTEVVPAAGAWLNNFAKYPWMWAAPVLGFVGPLIAIAGQRLRSDWLAFSGSSLAIVGIIGTVGCSMFPIILPSTVDAHSSLLVWNASSSHLTLFIMLLVTLVFLPIVLFYTAWVYKVLFGRIKTEDLRTNPDLY
ncbi:cytochrome d ubiquinol oxidase subunit II [Asticcacaulis benevestitus]|uniref:Cytochrome BD oxidase subunit II n=1 Tax=Asticcacaulis benevestitus DSM 16100 = ATCC BAA-896 TaxID=1121022 RepID=V4Q419_9CAUL|nr:cytochrome d ubiquinol oxidase subunit II [Asticcacaulis benevestitus]ESQ94469.1 cytochrome BD oxidase subunit II [Asticcacaulis benevestitus DSM 16100 = ATCC BAA-896]